MNASSVTDPPLRASGGACPVTSAVALVGGKWKVPILWHLSGGPRHFGALRRAVAGVSEKMLSTQLRRLEADGLISRTAHERADGGVPRRVDYALSETGWALVPALDALAEWGLRHLDGPWAAPTPDAEGRRAAEPPV